MDNIKKPHSKFSYEELLEQNAQLKNHIKEIKRKSKKVEEKFLYTENSRDTIEKLNNSGSWELDLINNKQTWSENYCFLLGYNEKIDNPDEQLFLTHVYHEDLDIVKAAMQKSLSEGKPIGLEFRYVPKDGSIRFARSKAEYIFDKKNKITNIIGTFQDITEHREFENLIKSTKFKAKESEIKYRNIIQSSPLGIILYKLEEGEKLIFNGYNKSAETILGVEMESLIGKTIEEAFPPLAQTEIPFEYKKTAKTGEEFFANQVDYDFDKINGAFEVRAFQTSPNNIAVNFSDITERLIKVEELKESQQKFKSLFDNIEEGVALHKMIFDEDNNPIDFIWVDVNPTYEKLTHLKKKDLIGRKGKDVIPTIEKKWYNLYAEVVLTGIPKTVTDFSAYLDKYWEVKAFRPYEGHFAVAMTDVTEKIKSEEKLKESESKFRILADNTSDWEYWLDESNKYVFISPSCEKITGYKDEEFYKNPDLFIELVREDYKDEVFNHYHDPNRIKPHHISEFPIINKNNKEVWIEHSCIPIYDEEGKFKGRRGNNRDITERKKAELELIAKNKELLKAEEQANSSLQQIKIIQANTPNITWKWEIDKEENFKNCYISEGVDEFLALPKGSIGNSMPKFFSNILPEYLPLVDDAIKNAIKSPNKLISLEYEVKKANGKVAWFSSSGKVIPKNNKLTIYGSTVDITDKKQNELELIKAKEQAEESDRLKSAFLANMSHEIRTPMNGILGFTELLQDASLSVENQKDYISIIQKSSGRLLNTVNDIIEISKIESGEINFKKSELDLIIHLDSLVSFFRTEAAKKDLEIVVQNSINRNDLSIQTDETKLNSILSNLIKNAIKYTNEGTIKVGFKIENGHILFFCKDSGIGIPKNRIEAIFNRFEQADIGDSRVFEGSGLGLAIVKSYVEMMDGKIWVESEEDKGSEFYVSLPYNPVDVMEKETSDEEKIVDSKKKNIDVLIVEDDEISSSYLYEISKQIAKNIKFARNGIEAVNTCKNNSSIDLIMMDIQMPEMDGYEATKKIREFNKDVVIIAQTAFAFEEDKQNALLAGCNDYISKPIKKEKLVEILNKYF